MFLSEKNGKIYFVNNYRKTFANKHTSSDRPTFSSKLFLLIRGITTYPRE